MLARSELQRRLRCLADDSDERARTARDSVAMLDYHRVATDARRWAADRMASDDDLSSALDALTMRYALARWHDGDKSALDTGEVFQPVTVPAPSTCPPSPSALLNPRQLGELFGMSENGAREAVKRGVRRNLAGFIRDGALWLADPHAFAGLCRKCGSGEGQGARDIAAQ